MFNLLLIDDEYEIRSGMSRFFPWETHGFEILGTCENGIEALSVIDKQQVDVILCDIKMPKMNVLELAKVLRKRNWPGEIVFISAHKDFDFAQQAIELGVKRYLVKPVGYEDLHRVLSSLSAEMETRKEGNSPQAADSFYKLSTIEHVEYFVEHNLSVATLQSAADIVNLSPNYLSKCYKRKTGRLFSDFLVEKRMEKAIELLKTERYKVYEISKELGYVSVRSFIRVFKEYFGTTPAQYSTKSDNPV